MSGAGLPSGDGSASGAGVASVVAGEEATGAAGEGTAAAAALRLCRRTTSAPRIAMRSRTPTARAAIDPRLTGSSRRRGRVAGRPSGNTVGPPGTPPPREGSEGATYFDVDEAPAWPDGPGTRASAPEGLRASAPAGGETSGVREAPGASAPAGRWTSAPAGRGISGGVASGLGLPLGSATNSSCHSRTRA